jgi:anti-anti-sigma factor
MSGRWWSHLKGDVAGGFTAAVLIVPMSMGYGILALQPLGDGFMAHGLLAGLLSAVIVPLTAVLLGAEATIMYAPGSIVALLIGSIAVHTILDGRAATGADPGRTLTLVFLVVFLAGLLQAMFGRFRLGSLVQYIPSPVMAGFQNGAAILIFLAQLDALLGFRQHVPPLEIPHHLGAVRLLTLAVGLVTAVAMARASRLTPGIPPAIAGLFAGCGAHYGLFAAGYGAGLGPTVGALPSTLLTPGYVTGFAGVLGSAETRAQLPALLAGAASLAIVASLDSLLSGRTVEAATGRRTPASRGLLRLGVGNMAAGCLGGISSGVSLAATFASHRSGARTPLAALVCAITILLAVVLLPPVIALVPRAVIAGLLLVTAFQLLDRWSVGVLGQMLVRGRVYWRSVALDMGVVALVATVAVAVNLVTAVGIGLGVAILSFLGRMSRSAVRRAYRGDHVRSHRTRDPRLMEFLHAQGRQILVLELEGPLFFGTAEELAGRVETALGDGVAWVVLDLKRVNEIDTTGVRILLQIHARVAARGGELALCHVGAAGRVGAMLRNMGVAAAVGDGRLHPDADRALEWAEDRLIARELAPEARGEHLPFEQLDVLAGLDARECECLRALLSERRFAPGQVVIREGDRSRELFAIVRGTASVRIRLPGEEREKRLATFAAGAIFGEVALLDREPRSATVQADDELVCYVLDEGGFETLKARHPLVAVKLLANIGRELGRRIRRTTATVYQLES